MQSNGVWYLLSAGGDCSVRVWQRSGSGQASNHRLTCVFREHVAAPLCALRALPLVPRDVADVWQHFGPCAIQGCFVTIGDDRIVALCSIEQQRCVRRFGPHQSSITGVWWRPQHDALFVLCDDQSVSIWQLSTSQRVGFERDGGEYHARLRVATASALLAAAPGESTLGAGDGDGSTTSSSSSIALSTSGFELLWHALERRAAPLRPVQASSPSSSSSTTPSAAALLAAASSIVPTIQPTGILF